MAGQTTDPTKIITKVLPDGTQIVGTTEGGATILNPITGQATVVGGNGVYNYFNAEDDIVLGSKQTVTEGFFTNNAGELTTFFTSSAQAILSSSRYYLNVYQTGSSDSGAEVQFDISYAKYGGISGGDS